MNNLSDHLVYDRVCTLVLVSNVYAVGIIIQLFQEKCLDHKKN
jgi:hypothetical protein